MSVLIWLVPMALGLGLTGLFAFLWSLRNNQYDDLEGAALRVLDDDDLPEPSRQSATLRATRSQLKSWRSREDSNFRPTV
jgi:cbb3-type cytochrome oxidase maturation protein